MEAVHPPRYDEGNLGQVLPAVASALGAGELLADALGDRPALARRLLGLPETARSCVVLVDGMGQEILSERSGHAPFLRSLLPSAQVLTVGFPTTTATSIGLFGTGAAAGRTGMVGYTARNPATGGLANLVRWTGTPPAREWQRVEPLFTTLAAGIDVVSVGPARFAGSGMTEAVLHGGSYRPAESLAHRVDAAVAALREPADRQLVYLYWGDVDKIGHHHGWRSWQWGDALAAADAELARLAGSVPPGTLLLITADHGMIDADPAVRWDVAAVPELADGVELVGGEPRMSHLYCRHGRAPDVARRWRLALGDAVWVREVQEAIDDGWFGPVSDHVRPMLGDLVVVARGRASIVDSRTQTPASLGLIGLHGALTAAESYVPLLVVG